MNHLDLLRIAYYDLLSPALICFLWFIKCWYYHIT